MTDLKCPNCGAIINLDEKREFGFCSYCGTKVQLVQKVKVVQEDPINVAGIRTEKQSLDVAQRMIELGEFSEAEKVLRKIVETSPNCGEAWLQLSCIRLYSFATPPFDISGLLGCDKGYYGACEKDNSSSCIKERLLNTLVNSREYIMTRKVMGDRVDEIYNPLIARCNNVIDDELGKSNGRIKEYISNVDLLSGYSTSFSDCPDNVFFSYKNETYMMIGNAYYVVKGNKNTIELTLRNFTLRTCVEPTIILPRVRSFNIVYINDKGNIYTTVGTFRKKHGEANDIKYANMLDLRRRNHQCTICGSNLSILGTCKGKCNVLIK